MSAAVAELFSALPVFAFFEGIGGMEMLLVAVIGLLLFGGKGLPEMARTFGKVMREIKKASSSVEAEVKRVMNEEPEDFPTLPSRPKRIVSAPLPPAELPAAATEPEKAGPTDTHETPGITDPKPRTPPTSSGPAA